MKYLKKINEYRGQLELPFNGKHPLHDKPTHIHVLDSIEDLSRKSKTKVEDYHTNNTEIDIDKYWDSAYDEAKEKYLGDSNYEYPNNAMNYTPAKDWCVLRSVL